VSVSHEAPQPVVFGSCYGLCVNYLTDKEITDLLENTNFFNAGKNTDKAVELLQKFFPAMENFQTQIRKYDQTLRSLKSDKSSLQKQTENLSRQVKEAKSSSMRKKWMMPDSGRIMKICNIW